MNEPHLYGTSEDDPVLVRGTTVWAWYGADGGLAKGLISYIVQQFDDGHSHIYSFDRTTPVTPKTDSRIHKPTISQRLMFDDMDGVGEEVPRAMRKFVEDSPEMTANCVQCQALTPPTPIV